MDLKDGFLTHVLGGMSQLLNLSESQFSRLYHGVDSEACYLLCRSFCEH